MMTKCGACRSEWINDPPFPESAEKSHGHVLERGERCGQHAGLPEHMDRQSTLPRKRREGPRVIMEVVTTCEAHRNEWTNGPPFPESAGKGHSHILEEKVVVSILACQSNRIIDPPFPESAEKGQEW